MTDTGVNLLKPGETPHENAQFLIFLAAVIKAVDVYQDLLRVSTASAANDHRLGANEAPPAIISIFLGEELTEILEAIESGTDYKGKEKHQMQIGVTALPDFPKDTTDRNRTSPFAFTGNKFEFRMVGSSFSIADPNCILNTVVADVLQEFADRLEKSKDFNGDLAALVKNTVHEHKRIIFNGNNYSDEWVQEAKKRGLSNYRSAVESLPTLVTKKSVELFTKHNVLTETELHSRYEILMEAYCKTIHIEALTMVDMVKGEIIPACLNYQNDLVRLVQRKKACGDYDVSVEEQLLGSIAKLSSSLLKKLTALENTLLESKEERAVDAQASFYRDRIFTAMAELRLVIDELETLVARKHWPFPTYAQILYSVI
jgi:glutamine synthetase